MEKNGLNLLGKRRAIEMLLAMAESPKRFSELTVACQNPATRSVRLKELEEMGLIEPTVKKNNGRNHIHYILTPKGKRAVDETLKLNHILAK
jgi:DNA-binding HxlR family transcriptional regulator